MPTPTPNIARDLTRLKRAYAIRFGACFALLLWGLLWMVAVAPRAGEYRALFLTAAWLFVSMALVLPFPVARRFRRLLSAIRSDDWAPCTFRITISLALDDRRCVAHITEAGTGRQTHMTLMSAPDRTARQNADVLTGVTLREHTGDRLPLAVKGDGPVYWAQSSVLLRAPKIASGKLNQDL